MVHFYLATSPSQSLVFLHHRRGLCNTFLHEFGRCCCKFRSFQALFDFEGLGGIVKVVAFIGMGVQCNNFIALSNFAGVAQPGMDGCVGESAVFPVQSTAEPPNNLRKQPRMESGLDAHFSAIVFT